MKYAIVIPARFKSTRFPGKPLVDICGKSMIRRVWDKCVNVLSSDDVYVATDDKKIANHCKSQDINVIYTSASCLTGTDRVAEAAKSISADILINVQGDEPLISPDDIRKVIEASCRFPNMIVNAKCDISEERDFRNPTVPKVVCRPDGRLLYMSRAAIPTDKSLQFVSASKQVCIYAFPKSVLQEFAQLENKTFLEKIEDIEILRFLELGYEIFMVTVSGASVAVDTPEDLQRVKEILSDGSN